MAIIRLIQKLSLRSLRLTQGFGGRLLDEANQIVPCCHGNEICDKIGYNLKRYLRDLCVVVIVVVALAAVVVLVVFKLLHSHK